MAACAQTYLDCCEVEMHSYLHDENIALYRKLIAESQSNPSRDQDRHAMLLTLFAEETAKAKKLPKD
jgi:hypothetical protein